MVSARVGHYTRALLDASPKLNHYPGNTEEPVRVPCKEKTLKTNSLTLTCVTIFALTSTAGTAFSQEESLSPKVNERILKDPMKAAVRFESPKRDVVKQIDKILKACELKPGMDVADVGAGSGLHARLFARQVAPGGKVYATEITQTFLDYIKSECEKQKIGNVVCVLGTTTSSKLEPNSVDLVFTSNVYHHFEYPFKMLDSIHSALRKGGRLVIIDDKKKSDHVRADQATVIEEVKKAGFKLIDERSFSDRNFMARFEKK